GGHLVHAPGQPPAFPSGYPGIVEHGVERGVPRAEVGEHGRAGLGLNGDLLHDDAVEVADGLPEQTSRRPTGLEGDDRAGRSAEPACKHGEVAVLSADVEEHHAWSQAIEEHRCDWRLDQSVTVEIDRYELRQRDSELLTVEQVARHFSRSDEA